MNRVSWDGKETKDQTLYAIATLASWDGRWASEAVDGGTWTWERMGRVLSPLVGEIEDGMTRMRTMTVRARVREPTTEGRRSSSASVREQQRALVQKQPPKP